MFVLSRLPCAILRNLGSLCVCVCVWLSLSIDSERSISDMHIHRGYHMPARRYEFYLRVELEKIKFISISGYVIFCLLYKHTYDDVIDYFPKIFPNLSEGQMNVSEHSPNIFRRLPKIAEDCRRLPKIAEDCRGRTDNVSIIQKDIWVLCQRLRS